MNDKVKNAIDEYNISPNICKYCYSKILAPYDRKLLYTKNKIFCNSSCASKFNNPKRKTEKLCPDCGKVIKKNSETCFSCLTNRKRIFPQWTKDDCIKNSGSYQSWRSSIRRDACRIFENSKQVKECFICGYNKTVDICHIIPVSSFPSSAKIIEINSIDNLVALCPNHHWEFDNNLIELIKLK